MLPVVSGPLMGASWVVGAATHSSWLGVYERRKVLLFHRSIEDGHVVFDIGAHAGYYTLIAAKAVGSGGRVVAFEPFARNIDYLRRHIDLNRVSNVTVIDAAVSDETGKGLFAEGKESQMGHLSDLGNHSIPTVAIDDLVFGKSLPPPNYIKMDIEGGEYRALKGMRKVLELCRPKILLATHGAEMNVDCFRLLAEYGYQVTPIDGLDLAHCRECLAAPKHD